MTQRRGKNARNAKKWVASIALALACLTATCARAQNDTPQKDNLFAGTEEFAKGATDTTEVNLDKNTLSMASKSLGLDTSQTEENLAKRLDFIYIREYKYAKPGQYNMADVQKFSKRLDGGGWSHVISDHSATENTDIFFRGGEASELVIMDADPTDLTFIHLKGTMSMADLSKLGQKYGAPNLKDQPQ